MKAAHRLALAASVAAFAVAGIAASLPPAMVGPGEWEVGTSAAGGGVRVCLPDPGVLAQWEHRARPCQRTVLTASADRAVIHYTCAGGGFGTSRVEELTPRSVKVETQGIKDGYPFARTVYAHRVGACAGH